MSKYRVYCFDLSFFTYSNLYKTYIFETKESLEELVTRLSNHGFKSENNWIMPGAILKIETVK